MMSPWLELAALRATTMGYASIRMSMKSGNARRMQASCRDRRLHPVSIAMVIQCLAVRAFVLTRAAASVHLDCCIR
jgi:hypothetical protein